MFTTFYANSIQFDYIRDWDEYFKKKNSQETKINAKSSIKDYKYSKSPVATGTRV